MLEELPDDLGLVLWMCLRDIMLWVGVSEETRDGLFAPEAESLRRDWLRNVDVPTELDEPLEVFTGLLGTTTGSSAARLESSSRAVAEWGKARGLSAVALGYAQVGALLNEASPELAYEVGDLASARGEDSRAETWYRHAVMLSREIADWKTYVRAFVALGDLYIARGMYDTAVKLHVRARRAAKRNSFGELHGMALHSLFIIAARRGQHDEAEELAAGAISAYGPRNRRLAPLARDIGLYRLDQGHHAQAVELLESALPHFDQPHERALVADKLKLAAAGAGDGDSHAAGEVSEHANRLSARLTKSLNWLAERSSSTG